MPRVRTHHVRTHHIPDSSPPPLDIRKDGAGITELDALQIATKAVEIYAARHPRPPHVTITQAAEMLGKSRPTVSAMLTRYKIRLNKCGQIPIESIDRLLAASN